MSKSIRKFNVPITDWPAIDMPFGALVLSARVQCDTLCVWALVDPYATDEQRTFRVIYTGANIESLDGLRFIGTFKICEGFTDFHLFEVCK